MWHVVFWDSEAGKHVYFNKDGTTTNDRDKAEIWLRHEKSDAEAFAAKHGASVLAAFDERDDDFDEE